MGPLVLGMGQGWGWECVSPGNSLGIPWISFGSILRVSVGSSQWYQLEGVLIQAPRLHQLWGYQLEHPEGISLRGHQSEHPNGVGLRGSVWASQLDQLWVESVQASQIHQPEGSQSEHPACTSCGGYQGPDGGRGYQYSVIPPVSSWRGGSPCCTPLSRDGFGCGAVPGSHPCCPHPWQEVP